MADLDRAQTHLAQLAGLADDGSPYIDKHLPVIMTTFEMLKKTLEQFGQGL